MDPLAGLTDGDDDSDEEASGSGSDAEAGKAAVPPAKRQKAGGIDLETLKAHGYKGGWPAYVWPGCSCRG